MAEEAKRLMEGGWKAREDLDFEKAEKLLTEAREMFEKDGDWFNVTESLNHLAYTQKLKAIQNNLRGMEYAKEAERLSTKYSTKKSSILRTLMSLASSLGLFEQALKWGKECLTQTTKPLSEADVLSHIAVFQLRTGKLEESEKTINEAESLMQNNWNDEKEPHRSIWKSKILATKSLILYNKGHLEEAKIYIKNARKIAEEQNLKTRLAEIDSIAELHGIKTKL